MLTDFVYTKNVKALFLFDLLKTNLKSSSSQINAYFETV